MTRLTFFSFQAIYALIVLLGMVAFSRESKAQPDPKIVNFVTGVPLKFPSTQEKESGFGDIAANVHAALVYKKNFPAATVNLIVTSTGEPPRSGGLTSAEIVKLMVPALRMSLKDKPQTAYGVNFIFLGADARNLLKADSVNEDMLAAVPQSDLAIQLSANDSPLETVVRHKSKLAMVFKEFTAESRDTVFVGLRRRGRLAPMLRLNAGPNSWGIYLDSDPNPLTAQTTQLLRNWFLRQAGLVLAPPDHIAFAYSVRAQSTQIYLDALKKIASADPKGRYILVTKNFHGLNFAGSPTNLIHVPMTSVSHFIFQALVRAADVSPLITGDVSLSLAMSSTREEKTFIYEVLDWKLGLAFSLHENMGGGADLWKLFLFTDNLSLLENSADQMANLLADREFNQNIHLRVLAFNARANLIHNVAHFYREFYPAIKDCEADLQARAR